MTTPPITRLLNLRRIAQKAARTGVKLDPQRVLDVIGGKKA